jgi:uncharacterized protein YlxP (DUF503 family)
MAVVHVAALRVELRIPGSRSLKEKRRVMKSLLSHVGRVPTTAVAEVDHQDLWQRATIAVAVVASSGGQLQRMLHAIERDLRKRDGVEVLATSTTYLEEPE